MSPVEKFLSTQSFMLLDGALATELERRGADLNDALWSAKCLMEQPALVRAVHRDYFEAGADVTTSATYQASFAGFARRGIAPALAELLLRRAVSLAVDARDEFWERCAQHAARRRPLIAASIGPYGAMLADGSEYRGGYTVSDGELRDFHRPQLAVLAASGADLFACETLPSLREALVLARLLEDFPSMTAWISFACQDGERNCEGNDIGECAAALQPFSQVVAVGINCTCPEYASLLLRRMANRTDKPLVVYPNSGERYDSGSKTWHGGADEKPLENLARSWFEAGARLIGGCCRTTPRDTAALYSAREMIGR